MILPIQIAYRNMEPSESISARVNAEAAKLNRYFDRITSCRVVVEAPHRHHRRGEPFHVRIELGVPREELVVTQAPSPKHGLEDGGTSKWVKHLEPDGRHKEMYVTIRDAFKAARRQLEDYVRRLRGDVKIHGRILPVRTEKLS